MALWRRADDDPPSPATPEGGPRFNRLRGRLGVALVVLGVLAEVALVVFVLVYLIKSL